MNARLRMMIESREIEELAADDAEVLGMWSKAVQSDRDSRIPQLTPGSAFTLAYQAALQAATAVIRASGYRVRETPKGHHRLTFMALSALEAPGLSGAGRHMNELRQGRHEAVYDWESSGETERLEELRTVLHALLPAARDHLCSQRPHLASVLPSLDT